MYSPARSGISAQFDGVLPGQMGSRREAHGDAGCYWPLITMVGATVQDRPVAELTAGELACSGLWLLTGQPGSRERICYDQTQTLAEQCRRGPGSCS